VVGSFLSLGRKSLDVRGPEGLHHLVGGEGAGGVTLPAHDLAPGGEAELGGEVVLGLGRSDVDVLEFVAVARREKRQLLISYVLFSFKRDQVGHLVKFLGGNKTS